MGKDHTTLADEAGLQRRNRLLIGGDLVPAGGGSFESVDPTTGRTLAAVPRASREDVDAAVGAARRAFDETSWARDLGVRRRSLKRLAELARKYGDEFALIDALDVGMTHGIARGIGARAMVRNLEYYGSWVDKIYGEVLPDVSGSGFAYTRRDPFGVVAAIYAWNSPTQFLGSKVGPALAAGNTIVLKPSELGSLGALRFAELCREAELPPGVVNVVTGAGDVGLQLVEHSDVDKISFTGGTATGKAIMKAASANLKKLHLELGGKSPNIVLADADLDKAATGAAMGCFALSGQACIAGSRLFVHESVHDALIERIVRFSRGLRLGDPMEKGVMLGPLVSHAQLERADNFVRAGVDEGATLVLDGRRPDGVPEGGFFGGPTIFTDVGAEMSIAREEIFAPVLSVFRFSDHDEVVEAANRTRFGLAAAVWTRDVAVAHGLADRLRAGTVWVNSYGTLPYTAPFGGFNESGVGREGGRDAIDEYTQVKTVSIALDSEVNS